MILPEISRFAFKAYFYVAFLLVIPPDNFLFLPEISNFTQTHELWQF